MGCGGSRQMEHRGVSSVTIQEQGMELDGMHIFHGGVSTEEICELLLLYGMELEGVVNFGAYTHFRGPYLGEDQILGILVALQGISVQWIVLRSGMDHTPIEDMECRIEKIGDCRWFVHPPCRSFPSSQEHENRIYLDPCFENTLTQHNILFERTEASYLIIKDRIQEPFQKLKNQFKPKKIDVVQNWEFMNSFLLPSKEMSDASDSFPLIKEGIRTILFITWGEKRPDEQTFLDLKHVLSTFGTNIVEFNSWLNCCVCILSDPKWSIELALLLQKREFQFRYRLLTENIRVGWLHHHYRVQYTILYPFDEIQSLVCTSPDIPIICNLETTLESSNIRFVRVKQYYSPISVRDPLPILLNNPIQFPEMSKFFSHLNACESRKDHTHVILVQGHCDSTFLYTIEQRLIPKPYRVFKSPHVISKFPFSAFQGILKSILTSDGPTSLRESHSYQSKVMYSWMNNYCFDSLQHIHLLNPIIDSNFEEPSEIENSNLMALSQARIELICNIIIASSKTCQYPLILLMDSIERIDHSSQSVLKALLSNKNPVDNLFIVVSSKGKPDFIEKYDIINLGKLNIVQLTSFLQSEFNVEKIDPNVVPKLLNNGNYSYQWTSEILFYVQNIENSLFCEDNVVKLRDNQEVTHSNVLNKKLSQLGLLSAKILEIICSIHHPILTIDLILAVFEKYFDSISEELSLSTEKCRNDLFFESLLELETYGIIKTNMSLSSKQPGIKCILTNKLFYDVFASHKFDEFLFDYCRKNQLSILNEISQDFNLSGEDFILHLLHFGKKYLLLSCSTDDIIPVLSYSEKLCEAIQDSELRTLLLQQVYILRLRCYELDHVQSTASVYISKLNQISDQKNDEVQFLTNFTSDLINIKSGYLQKTNIKNTQQIARKLKDSRKQICTNHILWATSVFSCTSEEEMQESVHSINEALDLYDSKVHTDIVAVTNHCPRLCGLAHLALCHFVLGNFKESINNLNILRLEAQAKSHDLSKLHALSLFALISSLHDNKLLFDEYRLDEVIEIADKNPDTSFSPVLNFCQVYMESFQDNYENNENLERMISIYQNSVLSRRNSSFLCVILYQFIKSLIRFFVTLKTPGILDQALNFLAQGYNLVTRLNQKLFHCMLQSLKAEIMIEKAWYYSSEEIHNSGNNVIDRVKHNPLAISALKLYRTSKLFAESNNFLGFQFLIYYSFVLRYSEISTHLIYKYSKWDRLINLSKKINVCPNYELLPWMQFLISKSEYQEERELLDQDSKLLSSMPEKKDCV